MKNKSLLKIFFLAFSLFFFNYLYAQAGISTQAHFSDVTDISCIAYNGEKTAVSAGSDGFLIKWKEDGNGEHYQISDLPIKMISRSPNGDDIAVYESDGASLNRVSLWNWKTLTRKFAYRFSDTVTSLNFSAKGTYLMCGTASVDGASLINTSNGSFVRDKIPAGIGTVNFMTTSDTENTVVTYLSRGAVAYYNLKTGKEKAKYSTEDRLSQVGLFNNNVFLAGVRANNIFIIQAVTGNTVGRFPAQNPILISSNKTSDLYFIQNGQREFYIYKIQNDRNKAVIAPELVRTFSGLKTGEKIVCADIFEDEIYAGTSRGNIYKFDYTKAERVDVVQSLSEKNLEQIYDIASSGKDFYFLSETSLFKSSAENTALSRIASNTGYKNLIAFDNGNGTKIILWSKDTRQTVYLIDPLSGETRALFTPAAVIQSLSLSGNRLADVEASSSVNIIDIQTGEKKQVYSGTGIQDALIKGENNLFIAKSNASTPAVPLLHINLSTEEIVPLNVNGNIAYSLTENSSSQNEFYGVIIYTDSRTKRLSTSVFSYNIQRKSLQNLLTISDEDNSAFAYLKDSVLYTNIGKNQIRSYNLKTRKNFIYKRSASMPLKIAGTGDTFAVLNRDGSISWYRNDVSSVQSDWHLTGSGL